MAIELRDADVKILPRKKRKEWFEVSLAMHKNQRHVVNMNDFLTNRQLLRGFLSTMLALYS